MAYGRTRNGRIKKGYYLSCKGTMKKATGRKSRSKRNKRMIARKMSRR